MKKNAANFAAVVNALSTYTVAFLAMDSLNNAWNQASLDSEQGKIQTTPEGITCPLQ